MSIAPGFWIIASKLTGSWDWIEIVGMILIKWNLAKIPIGVPFTNYLPKWVCYEIIYFVSLFFYYNVLFCWPLLHNSNTWHGVTRWQGRWDRIRKCWPARRDHTCWSTRHFLLRFPIKALLLLRFICTTKSLKWFMLS